MSKEINNESQGDPVVFETLTVRKEGAVLFAEIAAPPMNLLGPELVRDLVSLIQTKGRDRRRLPGARVQERRPQLFHFSRRRDAD